MRPGLAYGTLKMHRLFPRIMWFASQRNSVVVGSAGGMSGLSYLGNHISQWAWADGCNRLGKFLSRLRSHDTGRNWPSTYCFSRTIFLGDTDTNGSMHNEDVSWLPVWTVQSVPSTSIFFPPHMKAKRVHTAWLKQILSQRRLNLSFVNNAVGCKAAGIVNRPSAHIREIMRNSFWIQACSLFLIFIEASVFQLHAQNYQSL